MNYQEIKLNLKGSLPGAKLKLYIQSDSEELKMREKPLVLICPGGGYGFVSDREAEPIAFTYLAKGYHAAVLYYSVAPAKYPTALLELAYSMQYIRAHAKEWQIKDGKVILIGFSAGAHLAACLGVFWQEAFLRNALELKKSEILRPTGMILGYPVITSGEYAHAGSFENLVGNNEEQKEYLSLEKRVTLHTPPVFLWNTFTDVSVPMENSLLFVKALREKNISVEYHLFSKGCHGLSLANEITESATGQGVQKECTSWVELSVTWLEGLA